MLSQPPDLYATLGVGRRATTDEVEAAFAAWEARVGGGEAIADEVWQRVRYAHRCSATRSAAASTNHWWPKRPSPVSTSA